MLNNILHRITLKNCLSAILFLFYMSYFSQNANYIQYYENINKAEFNVLKGDFKKADSIYRSLLGKYTFFYKDLYNASIISKLTMNNSTEFEKLLKSQNDSEEVLKIYNNDQYNRKFLGKIFKSKNKRIREDEINFEKAKQIILNRNIPLYGDDMKRLSIIITHNVDKKGFDSSFRDELKNLIVEGRIHPILYSNIFERYHIIKHHSRYYNNTMNYLPGNNIILKDSSKFLMSKVLIDDINKRRLEIFLPPIQESQQLFPVYLKYNLKYYLFL